MSELCLRRVRYLAFGFCRFWGCMKYQAHLLLPRCIASALFYSRPRKLRSFYNHFKTNVGISYTVDCLIMMPIVKLNKYYFMVVKFSGSLTLF